MKSITRLSLALIMFPLFSILYLVTSVSADMYNPPPNPSNDPSNTMKSESVDLNKQTLQLHKRITELEQQLNEERAKSEKQLNAVRRIVPNTKELISLHGCYTGTRSWEKCNKKTYKDGIMTVLCAHIIEFYCTTD